MYYFKLQRLHHRHVFYFLIHATGTVKNLITH